MSRLFSLLFALAGCDGPFQQSCTLMFAPDSLVVQIDGAFDDGAWAFALGPDRSCWATVAEGVMTVDGCDVDLTLTVVEGGVELLAFDYAPENFDLLVTRDDAEILFESLTPDYVVDEPNGEGCGQRALATEHVAF